MRLWIAVLIIFGVMMALSTLVGLLFWVGIAGLIIACVAGLIRGSTGGPGNSRPLSRRQERRIDKQADKALKEMERKNQS